MLTLLPALSSKGDLGTGGQGESDCSTAVAALAPAPAPDPMGAVDEELGRRMGRTMLLSVFTTRRKGWGWPRGRLLRDALSALP